VRWLHRLGAPPGTTSLLLDAVRGLDLEPMGLYARCCPETAAMTAVRHHLRRVVGLPRDAVAMTGYWRR
jgi:NADPH-dependent ferric siderophore reductase